MKMELSTVIKPMCPMRNNKKEGVVPMSKVLKDFKAQNKLSQGFLKVDVDSAWKDIMGPGVMTYTTAVKLSGDKLFIDLSSSVLRQELYEKVFSKKLTKNPEDIKIENQQELKTGAVIK